MDVRNPKHVVREAELLASSPERVREWLKESAQDESLQSPHYGGLEQALLSRANPLITLSLAQYSPNEEVVRTILAGPARSNKPLRLAALMNEVLGKVYAKFPSALLVGSQGVDEFLSSLDSEEVSALFSNGSLSDEFLCDFLEQKSVWQVLGEERQFSAIAALRQNPRMSASYDGPYDGWAEHSHNRVFSAAWLLSTKVPVTQKWAAYLAGLYEKVRTDAVYSVENPLEVAARWVPSPEDQKCVELERQGIEQGLLRAFARVRQRIARLAVERAHSKEERSALASHEDPAVRAAYYAWSELTLEEMKAADERDLLLSFEQMTGNPAAWRTKAHRELLHAMAWDSKRDPNSYMDPQNIYRARLEYYQRERPEWFRDEDEPAPSSGMDVHGDPLEKLRNDLIQATHVEVLKLVKWTAWIGVGVLAIWTMLILKVL